MIDLAHTEINAYRTIVLHLLSFTW